MHEFSIKSVLYINITEKEKPTESVEKDVRNFEYTRQQWTGKSPKQFLIDWVRKHLKGSRPPSYTKAHVKGNLLRCR